MKTFISLVIIFSFTSCSKLIDNCACTMEFRMYTVLVLDSKNQPVDSLDVVVKNKKTGKVYIFMEKIYLGKGVYQVMNDRYLEDFSSDFPSAVLFTASKSGVSVEAEYWFITDNCNCHVSKVAGSDTLRINL
ncbi:MAG: hypothetical protein N3A61_05600 [Ignavibacteria bacterium]|nr:hypothetical protein [Ignavibacteria bacterium]